jgi:YD repeat-containing protein
MILTKELLHQNGACEEGIAFCERNKLFGFDLDRIDEIQGDYDSYIEWINTTIISPRTKTSPIPITDSFTISEYDDRNNKISDTYAEGSWWIKYEYDEKNNKTRQEESTGHIIVWEYDKRNNVIKSKWVHSNFEVLNTYDDNDNLIFVSDSSGYTIEYQYDSNNNCVYESHSNGHFVKQEYDLLGRLIKYEKFGGNSSEIEYDSRNNKIHECHFRAGTNNTFEEYWEYDEHSNLIKYKSSSIQEPITYTVEYYDNGQLKRYNDLFIPLI